MCHQPLETLVGKKFQSADLPPAKMMEKTIATQMMRRRTDEPRKIWCLYLLHATIVFCLH